MMHYWQSFIAHIFGGLLSSRNQFDTKGPKISPQNPSLPHPKALISTHPSVPHNPQLHTENPSIPHTPQFNNKNPSLPHKKTLSSTTKTSSVQMYWTEGICCWTEGFWVLKRSLCWTDVLNWGVCVELRGTLFLNTLGFFFILILKIVRNFLGSWKFFRSVVNTGCQSFKFLIDS